MLDSDKQLNQKDRVGKTSIIFETRDYPNYSILNELIPHNCFVG